MADTNEVYRLFIAVVLPEEVKAGIGQAQDELRRAVASAKIGWTRPDQFHVTLKFLGDVETQRVAALAEAVRGACRGCGPMRLKAAGLGCFPNPRSPRVVWAGVQDEGERLAGLQRAVETASVGFTLEERSERFTGHVTIGRVKSIRHAEAGILAGLLRDQEGRLFGEWTAEHIEIVRSELSPKGARHTTIEKLSL
jgi:2'-5' RNA ligase